jgi:hypothetical protein
MLMSNIDERDVRVMPGRGTVIAIRCRDFRRYTFLISTEEHAAALLGTIDSLSVPGTVSMCA